MREHVTNCFSSDFSKWNAQWVLVRCYCMLLWNISKQFYVNACLAWPLLNCLRSQSHWRFARLTPLFISLSLGVGLARRRSQTQWNKQRCKPSKAPVWLKPNIWKLKTYSAGSKVWSGLILNIYCTMEIHHNSQAYLVDAPLITCVLFGAFCKFYACLSMHVL